MNDNNKAKVFTWKEIQEHGSETDCWIVIEQDGVCGVYDVTSWLGDHPGGGEIILEYGGRDATSMFEDIGHSSEARNQMKKFLIG